MSPHEEHCHRAKWLLRQPRARGLVWIVLFQEGPPCTCGAERLFSAEQTARRDGSGG